MSLKNFLDNIRTKSVHVVGVTGAEGSNILRFLVKNGITNITTHDYVQKKDVEKNFRLWHKGTTVIEREKLLNQFLKDVSQTSFHDKKNYLNSLLFADIIFVPQSWRLYIKQNKALWEAKKKNIPFYTLTRLYLDCSKAQIIAVTGTVGKGSVSYLIAQLLEKLGKHVYFAGNDTWMVQLLDQFDEMKQTDFLILEISHRQLLDGFIRAPHYAVVTNIYQNHLDEVGWDEYRDTKLSLIKKQKKGDIAVLNYDSDILKKMSYKVKSEVIYYSSKSKLVNTKNIQKHFSRIMSIKSEHYTENILCAMTVLDSLNLSLPVAMTSLPSISTLPARCQMIAKVMGRIIYDDLKSTTPWATLAAIKKLGRNLILISAGQTKGIDYTEFIKQIKGKIRELILIQSELSNLLVTHSPNQKYTVVNSLENALQKSIKDSQEGDSILISPAAAFFYTQFVKGKQSIRKIITSLVQEVQKSEVTD